MATTEDPTETSPAGFKEDAEGDEIRRSIADTYTFVRSAELNRTVSSFTLDHYIDEAKRRIKDPRILRAASDPTKGVGTRPSKLDTLTRLEEDFNKSFNKAVQIAKNQGSGGTA